MADDLKLSLSLRFFIALFQQQTIDYRSHANTEAEGGSFDNQIQVNFVWQIIYCTLSPWLSSPMIKHGDLLLASTRRKKSVTGMAIPSSVLQLRRKLGVPGPYLAARASLNFTEHETSTL